MSGLLKSAAIGSKSGDEAAALLEGYIATEPQMVHSFALGATQAKQPEGTGAGDHLIRPR